ncbi:energy transducer TonB [Desulfuromonas sp. CSMB_57]|uniref:energy transducer TonB n=1 Tax=Desulfuromonas sp. CSMB_57 TaxID=2807629 RepID=UPI001CD7EE7D|nr:energy transducer TonB [Desulfuromonas sp. CSMB_57]
MNGRQDLAIFGISLVLHAMLVLALGDVLTRPGRILQRIEVDLEQILPPPPPPKQEAPAPPAPEPAPPKPKPASVVTPPPKPVPRPVERPAAPQPVPARPIIAAPEEPEGPVTTAVAAVPPGTPEGKPAAGTGVGGVEGGGSAAGSPDGATAGGRVGGRGQGQSGSGLQGYLAAVRARIEAAKRYPKLAEQRRTQGVALVTFRLTADGRLIGEPQLARSSGSSLLDGAALRAVKQAAPFPRFPGPAHEMPEEPLSVELNFIIR